MDGETKFRATGKGWEGDACTIRTIVDNVYNIYSRILHGKEGKKEKNSKKGSNGFG